MTLDLNTARLFGAIIGPMYLILGLSVLFYAGAWLKIIQRWRKDHYQILPIAIFGLIGGLIMVNLFNVWAWNIWLIITLTGWSMILKSVYYLLGPNDLIVATLKLAENKVMICLGGLISIALGAVLIYYSFFEIVLGY
ncbi:MAG: hypothetical protein WC806_01395 [Candidatus Gracilibacteria bacterium]|jgi:hypothetical protein